MKKLLVLLIVLLSIAPAYAHPGATDYKGGHVDYSTGIYHFHHGYPAHQHTDGVCPYDFIDKTGENSGSSGGGSGSSSPWNTDLVHSNLKLGDRGNYVAFLQDRLNSLGYACGTVDGIFGANTESALKAYQESQHLFTSGTANYVTMCRLFPELAPTPTPKPTSTPTPTPTPKPTRTPSSFSSGIRHLWDGLMWCLGKLGWFLLFGVCALHVGYILYAFLCIPLKSLFEYISDSRSIKHKQVAHTTQPILPVSPAEPDEELINQAKEIDDYWDSCARKLKYKSVEDLILIKSRRKIIMDSMLQQGPPDLRYGVVYVSADFDSIYHNDKNCNHRGLYLVSLKSIKPLGLKPCERCENKPSPDPEVSVLVSRLSRYYHATWSSCLSTKREQRVFLSEARSRNLLPCPKCHPPTENPKIWF